MQLSTIPLQSYIDYHYDTRLYSELNTISRYRQPDPANASLPTLIYCNQFVGDDKWSIYGISCHEFGGWPSEYTLDGGKDANFYLFPIGDSRPYSDVILYGVESLSKDDLILSSNFSRIENLVLNQNYTYRGIIGECSSDPDPLSDGSFKPIYEYLNIGSDPRHVYSISIAEKNNYDTDPANWQDLGIRCYVPNDPCLYIFHFMFLRLYHLTNTQHLVHSITE